MFNGGLMILFYAEADMENMGFLQSNILFVNISI